jgi:general stress protein 26
VCELTSDEVIAALERENTISLATSADNRVTIRPMSHVNDGLTVYFQTGEHYLKSRQIRVNPNVAMAVGNLEIEGTAEIIGHPMNEANRIFIDLYSNKHPNHAGRWSTMPNQVVVKVEITEVREWRYIEGKPVIAIGHFRKS